jgi:hypothetical protein
MNREELWFRLPADGLNGQMNRLHKSDTFQIKAHPCLP